MAVTHSSIHLSPRDARPQAMVGQRGIVWVALAGEHGAAQVFPATPEQAEALAAAFADAAHLMRSVEPLDVRDPAGDVERHP